MSDLLPLQGVLTVIEAAAASFLLPPMAWLLTKAWRRSAAARRLVWITAFAMLLGLPLLALVAPSLAVIALPAPSPEPVSAAAAVPVAAPAPSGFSWFDLIPLAAAVWLAGLAKLGAEHLVALVRLELKRRRAAPWPLPLRLRGCDLLVSEECPGPMTWGVLRPVILLPDEALDWPPGKLAIVLRHEMAHVRRRDGLAQALALIACALYWPNPLVWAAARALRREAELAADDMVIASGVRPSDYAGQLLELAAEWRERRLTPTGLAMAAPPALSQRVQSILSTDAIRTGATTMDALKLALLGGAATAALVLARPSVAEVPAPLAPPAAAQPTPSLPIGSLDDVKPAPDPRPAPQGRRGEGQIRLHVEPNLQLAAQDLQDSPAPPAPPAPPAISVQPVPPAPPAPPAVGVAPLPPAPPAGFRGRVYVAPGRMTPEQRAELEKQRADLDRQLAQIGPTIDKAIADAHIDETVQRALSAQDAKTREEVARQLAEIGPRIQQAIANAHIQELVQQRLAQIQPQIEAAMRENRQRAQERAAQAEERMAQQLEEQAKRARERAQRDRERLNAPQPPQPQPPKN